jgi:hypothetical protein
MESETSSYSSSSSSRDKVMSLSAALSSSGGLYAGSAMLKQVCWVDRIDSDEFGWIACASNLARFMT